MNEYRFKVRVNNVTIDIKKKLLLVKMVTLRFTNVLIVWKILRDVILPTR